MEEGRKGKEMGEENNKRVRFKLIFFDWGIAPWLCVHLPRMDSRSTSPKKYITR